jgi:hypothetical protein
MSDKSVQLNCFGFTYLTCKESQSSAKKRRASSTSDVTSPAVSQIRLPFSYESLLSSSDPLSSTIDLGCGRNAASFNQPLPTGSTENNNTDERTNVAQIHLGFLQDRIELDSISINLSSQQSKDQERIRNFHIFKSHRRPLNVKKLSIIEVMQLKTTV